MARRVDKSVWEERREWIGRQQTSGLSVARFCREHGLHEANFHAWRQRFAKTDDRVVTAQRTAGAQPLRAFVQLPLQPVAQTNGSAWIEVSVADGVVVRVPASNLAALDVVLSSLTNRSREEARHA